MRITPQSGDGTVLVTIRDTGLGVDAGVQFRIFDPSFTTKRGGLGLGLSISRSIIETHSGRIWIDTSNHAAGATFRIVLPTAEGPTNE